MADPAFTPLKRAEGPLFAEAWEAQALALAAVLRDAGAFSATEWAEALGAAIRVAQAAGDPDDGTTYYAHVLAALEGLVVAKGLADEALLGRVKGAWIAAHEATPHGQPVPAPVVSG